MQKDIAKYQFAVKCGHIEADDGRELYETLIKFLEAW